MEKRYVIYALTDPRTEIVRYIGKTGRQKERKIHHLRAKAHGAVGQWERKLKNLSLAPIFSILEDGLTTESVDERERFWIREMRERGCPLLNLMDGGEGWRVGEVPAEVRDKISDSMRQVWQDPEARQQRIENMTAALANPEVRAKISEASRNRVISGETREKISETVTELWQDPEYAAHQSEVHKASSRKMWEDEEFRRARLESMRSPEVRAKIGAASKKMWEDPEFRERMSEERRNRTLSEEHKAKIGAASKKMWSDPEHREKVSQKLRGRTLSEEHKAKIAESVRKSWEKRRKQ